MLKYTQNDMFSAVTTSDYTTLKAICSDRNLRNSPNIDFNNITSGGYTGTALHWAMRSHHIDTALVRLLLELKDKDDQPIIDRNLKDSCGMTIREVFNQRSDELDDSVAESIADLFFEFQIPYTQLHIKPFTIPPIALFDPNAIATIQTQLDEVNTLLAAMPEISTLTNEYARLEIHPLISEQLRQFRLPRYDAFADLREVLAQHDTPRPGATPETWQGRDGTFYAPTDHEWHAEQVQQQEPLYGRMTPIPLDTTEDTPWQDIPTVGQQEDFATESENTHDPMVTITVKESLTRLQKRYGSKFKAKTATSFAAVKTYVSALPDNHRHKSLALNCLDRLADFTYPDVSYQLTHLQVLALVWQAIHDTQAVPFGVKTTPDNLIKIRCEALVECLSEAETTGNFNDGKACGRGTLNKLVEALDHGHPDVHVAKGSAKETASEMVFALLQQKFNELPEAKRRDIINNWDNEESQPNPKIEFMLAALNEIQVYLKSIFVTGERAVLSTEQIDNIIDLIKQNLQYIEPFNLPTGIIDLIKTIKELAGENTPNKNALFANLIQLVEQNGHFTPLTQPLIAKLQTELAKNIRQDKSFDESYYTIEAHFMAATELTNEELSTKIAKNLATFETRGQKFSLSHSNPHQDKFIRACRNLLTDNSYSKSDRAFVILLLQHHNNADLRNCVSEAQPYRTAEQIEASMQHDILGPTSQRPELKSYLAESLTEKYKMVFAQIPCCDTQADIAKQIITISNASPTNHQNSLPFKN